MTTNLTPLSTPLPYPIWVAAGVHDRLATDIPQQQLVLISDSTVAAHYADGVLRQLAQRDIRCYTIPAGEASKSLAQFGALQQRLASDGIRRDAAIVALGGGMVSDLAGFVAASYMRGIAWYALPTTTLAMVDAAVGGKTAINLPQGKNLVGAFWQPRAVFADIDTLASLPAQLVKQGLVEAFKAGILADASLCSDVLALQDGEPTAATRQALGTIVRRAVQIKANIVAHDNLETGVRAVLNLGHTLGHALERASTPLNHGDAVAYGLYFAACLGEQRGYHDWRTHAQALLHWLRPARLAPALTLEELMPYMERDKKHQHRSMRWVLMRAPQQPELCDDISASELRQAWRSLQHVAQGLAT